MAGVRTRILTPERIPLILPLAGLGERSLAYLIDLLILVLALIAGLFIYNFWGDLEQDVDGLSATGSVLLGVGLLLCVVLYDVAFEVLGGGRTPGKRLMRLRVVTSAGQAPGLATSLLRNCMRLADMIPLGYGVGTVALFFTRTRRLGDLVADTVVVSERSRRRDPLSAARALAQTGPSRPWNDDDVLAALSILEQTLELEPVTRARLCARTLERIDGELSRRTDARDAAVALASVVMARAGEGGVAAELRRLWDATTAMEGALAAFHAARSAASVDVLDGAARTLGSELMRASRRRVPLRACEPSSLLLLDVERLRRPRIDARLMLRRFFFVDVPATVWAERGLVTRCAAVLTLGALLGGALAFGDPDLARAIVGDDTAQRIEEGANWTNAIEREGSYASTSIGIILNNVGVGLRVFAVGILGGIATLLGLLLNGVQLGAVFGYALRLDTAETLARFIVAHGPVELSMICVAGAAGMCLGRAVVAPGQRTRLRALREEGARGARLATFATVGFFVIGGVEGFVSPGSYFPTAVNALIGVCLWLLFLFWAWRFGRPAGEAAALSLAANQGRGHR